MDDIDRLKAEAELKGRDRMEQAQKHPERAPGHLMTIEEAMRQTGTSTPREARQAMNQGRVGRNRLVYLPHVGAKDRAKAAKRLAKMQAKALVP